MRSTVWEVKMEEVLVQTSEAAHKGQKDARLPQVPVLQGRSPSQKDKGKAPRRLPEVRRLV